MSLVNDMLRDLDQRRGESENPRGRVALTPANEYPGLEKSWTPYYVVFALILVVAGLAYLWMQLDQGSGPRSLNVRSELALDAADAQFLVDEPAAELVGEVRIEAAEIEEARIVEPRLDEPTQLVQEAIVAEIITTNQGINLQELAQAIAEINNQELPNVVIESTATAAEGIATEAVEESAIVPAKPQSEIQRTETVSLSPSAVVDGERATRAIKDPADLSAQQQDVLAVQEALRIIATNKPDAAYAVLGEYIAENRYAHQSRETYAKLLLSQGALRQAADLVEAGLQLAPNHAGFKKIKARLLVSNGDIGAAVELLLRRAPEVSADVEYHEILATVQLASRDYEGAAVSYTSLLREDRNQGKYWYGFAASQDFLGNRREARQAYAQAVQQSNLSANLRLRSEERLSSLVR